MKAVMVLNGPVDDPEQLKAIARATPVMAVDGGLAHVHRAGLHPRWILGDFDSVAPELLDCYRGRAEIIYHPVEKDYTDLELAVQHLARLGVDRLFVAGLQGGARADHQLAGWLLFATLAESGWRVTAYTAGQVHYFSGNSHVLLPRRGRYFSVQAPAAPAVISILGARYSGLRLELLPGSGFGLGNRIDGKWAQVKVHRGPVCISQWEEKDS